MVFYLVLFMVFYLVSVERFEINEKVQLRNLGKHRNKSLKFPSGILCYLDFSGTWVILLKCRVGVMIYTRWGRFGYVPLHGLQAIVKVVILKRLEGIKWIVMEQTLGTLCVQSTVRCCRESKNLNMQSLPSRLKMWDVCEGEKEVSMT